jgi:hypothetical protein
MRRSRLQCVVLAAVLAAPPSARAGQAEQLRRLTVEPYADNPQLENERLVIDGGELELEPHYEIHRLPPQPVADR